MAVSAYCEFNTKLSDLSYEDGLPRCFQQTVSCLILVLIIILAGIPPLLWILRKRKQKAVHYEPFVEDVNASIDTYASDILLSKKTQPFAVNFSDSPAEFIYGENYRTSFLYTCQLFFHICQILLPIIDLIVKGALESSRIQGVTLLNDGLTFITWSLAYFIVMIETQNRYLAKISRYSLALLLFWTLIFINDNIILISWNSKQWWFSRDTATQNAEFVLFWLRYSFSGLLFLLGLKAPGLYKRSYTLLVEDSDTTSTQQVGHLLYRLRC